MNRRQIIKSIIAAIASPLALLKTQSTQMPKFVAVKLPPMQVSYDYGKSWVEMEARAIAIDTMPPGMIVKYPYLIGPYDRE